MDSKTPFERYHLPALALLGLVLFFHRLGVPGLMDPDEGRYAEIAREIWVLSDWLIPHLNFLPYLEKPPLTYWLTALSFGGLGYTEFAARLPAALSALGGVFLAYGLGRALWGAKPAFCGALVLATCGGYVVLGRILTLDMVLTLFLNLGIALGYLALSRDREHLWPWAYLALALGALTKGPVAVALPGIIWAGWLLITRRPLRPLVQPRCWLMFLAITLPWFIYATWRYPDFFRFFILEQHLGRYLTPAIHGEPFYYYVPVSLGLMLPWTMLLPWTIGRTQERRDPDRLFLLIWAAAVLLFFSLSRGKLAPYILPAMLPLALLVGQRLAGLGADAVSRFSKERGLTLSLMVWALAGWAALALYLRPPDWLAELLALAPLLSPYLTIILAIAALTPTLALIRRRLGVLFLGALLMAALVPGFIEKISVTRSPRVVGEAVKSHWQPGAVLLGFNLYSQAVSFYSGQVFHLWSFGTELEFGRSLVPGNPWFFDHRDDMVTLAQSRALTLFYLQASGLSGLETILGGRTVLLARYKDCILVTYRGKMASSR